MFNIAFWTLLGSMFLIRGWFGLRVWRTGERVLPDRCDATRGVVGACDRRFVFLLLAGLIVQLWFRGGSLRAFAFSAPPWLRWVGLGLGVTSVGLFAWTHAALGEFWSTALQLRPGHRLITAGPYARLRHPMYSAILGWMTSLGLVAGSWIPLVFASLCTMNFILRIRPEEKMMLQQFGDEYRAYMKRTGRLLPV